MKKLFSFKASLCTLMLCLILCGGTASAQTPAPVINPDNYWYSGCGSAGYIAGLNTAVIDYEISPGVYGQLAVSAYFGNGTAGGVEFLDVKSGCVVDNPYCSMSPGTYIAGTPDIIVGNDPTSPLTNFRVAVAYPTFNSIGSCYEIDYFEVQYTGPMPGCFIEKYITSNIIPVPSTGVIHIDGIGNEAHTGPTGLPFVNRFVVAYDAPGGVMAQWGLLSTTSLHGTMPCVLPGSTPDVAAIQRCTTPACVAHHNMALFAYLGAGGSQMMYSEWDINTGSCSLPLALGPSYTYPFSIGEPRIDAPDDYTVNFPMGTTFAYYKIAAQVYNAGPGTAQSFTWDNTMCPTCDWPNSGPFIPGYIGDAPPSVAYGGNNGTEYQVAEYTSSGSATNFNYYMEPIQWNNPYSVAVPYNMYYQVNLFPVGFVNGNIQTAISSPANNQSDITFAAWAYGSMNTTVFYKATNYGLPNPFGYQFRQAQAGVQAVSSEGWKVFPNPATTGLTVNNPGGSYEITDMLGRSLLKGDLTAGEQTLDISALVPGSYIFTGNKGDTRDFNAVFVKQ